EIVVMTSQREEVARAGFDVARDQLFGAPVLSLPLADDVEETRTAGVAIMFEVMLVSGLALHPLGPAGQVEQPRVPVAPFGLALRPPMRPDAELRVAEPVGHAVMGRERFPIRRDRRVGCWRGVESSRNERGGAAAGPQSTAG